MAGQIKRKIAYSLVTFIVLVIIVLFTLLGPIARYVVGSVFEQQNLSLSASTQIAYDPFINELSISDLAVLHESTPLISLDSLLIEFDIIPLFSKELIVNSIQLSGLSAQVSQRVTIASKTNGSKNDDVNGESEWFINGWSINTLNDPEASTSPSIDDNETKATTRSENPTASITNITINKVTLDNINIDAELPQQRHALELSTLDLTQLQLALNEDGTPKELSFKLATALQSRNEVETLKVQTELEFDTQPSVYFDGNDIRVSTTDDTRLSLNNTQISDPAQDLDIKLDSLLLSLSKLQSQLVNSDNETMMTAQTNASFNTSGLTVHNNERDVNLVSLASIDLAPAQLSFSNTSTNPTPSFSVVTDEFKITDLTLMSHLDDTKPTLSKLDKLVVSGIDASSEGSSVELIQIGKLNNNLLIDKSKQLANLYLPRTKASIDSTEPTTERVTKGGDIDSEAETNTTPNPKHSSTSVPAPAQPNEAEPAVENVQDLTSESVDAAQATQVLPFKLTEVINVAPITLNTIDMSVSPSYRSLLEISHLNLQNLDSQKPEQVTTFSLNATNNKYAKINISAQSQPFIPAPLHDIKVTLDEIDLSAISPYVSSALGYHINSGQLDSVVTTNITGNKIDGDANLLLRSIDLTAISDQGEQSSVSGGAISFNYALGMLKDGDGNVDLSVPFSGDLNNPSVGFSGFLSLIVKRATMSAAKDYLINTFVPYANVVNFALSASKHILKLRFNDLMFESKQTELTETQQETLTQLALVLEKHDSVAIKICPISTADDLSDVNERVTAKAINANQVSVLLELAQQRADLVKNTLVESGKVTSKRLLFCSPTIDYDENASPRLSFEQVN